MLALKFDATTSLTGDTTNLIITGNVVCNDGINPEIQPDTIYVIAARWALRPLSLGPVRQCFVFRAYCPNPGPTPEDIVSSPEFQALYNAPGAIGWALSQPNDGIISLPGEEVVSQSDDGLVVGIKEWFAPVSDPPDLVVVLDNPVQPLNGATIDIVGGTLTTLAGGQRALVNPQAVYVYVDADGNYLPPPPTKDLSGIMTRVQIAP